jgi:AraC family transcriptional regulator
MRQEGPGNRGSLGPLDWLKRVPFEPTTASDRLGWVSLEAARFRGAPASELNQPAITHHRLFRFTRPPEELDLPPLRAAMWAVDAELTASGAGGPLAAESLANVLAVGLIRHVLAPAPPKRRRDGALPLRRLRAVVEYIEEHLDTGPTLEQMAAATRLSIYHFTRQFKVATGLPPHQYVILRRVERAKELLLSGTALSLAEVAARAGFSDQSQISHHLKRLVGVTPGEFRGSARIA